MRILIVSNLYPPHYIGGYEIRCAQVAEALSRSGHEVRVLTSTYGSTGQSPRQAVSARESVGDVVVHRRLSQYAFKPFRKQRPWYFFQARSELADLRAFQDVVRSFKPDVVNWWSMYGLSSALLPLPGLWGIPDVHWIEHWWMMDDSGKPNRGAEPFWTGLWDGSWGPRWAGPVLRVLGRQWEKRTKRAGFPTRNFASVPTHVCFVSEHMAQLHAKAGLAFPSSEVIHGGVPVEKFHAPVRRREGSASVRLLYAGQISPDRGLLTIVEALGRLDASDRSRVTLHVAGSGSAEYLSRVRERIDVLGLAEAVTFLGKVSHDEMPSRYQQHDVLVFPSARHEGLPLTMVEAMLSGCAVVTTGAGGAREIADAAQLPTFQPNDAAALADCLRTLLSDERRIEQIAMRGQQVALDEFSFDRMLDRFTRSLQRLARKEPRRMAEDIESRTTRVGSL